MLKLPGILYPQSSACQTLPSSTVSQSLLNSCSLSWSFYLTISSSAAPFSSCHQSSSALGSLSMSQFFTSGVQSIAASASETVLHECSRLSSFRIDWFDCLEIQGTLKSLLQNHNLKALILWCSAFFMVQLLHPYITTGKTITLTIQTFAGKLMSRLFKALSKFVIISILEFHDYRNHPQ